MSNEHRFTAPDLPIGFAHRGGTEHAGENTFAAFAHAVEVGFRYLETDVHLTADGEVVAFHDETLDRVTDETGRIDALDLATVTSAEVVGGGRIPTLADLLEAFPDVMLNIDAKSDAVADPLMDLLRAMDAIDRVCVASFSSKRLSRIRAAAGPGLCTALAPSEVATLRAGSVRGIKGNCVQIPTTTKGIRLATPRMIDRAHRAGLSVHIWTINDPDEMNELLDIGVDGIMTDRPSVLREVLESRGAWA
ncbi:MAG: glycerophosphodiester phosphodiesterase [Acidobacteria bacterium]|nr:glycerophosphodiester phosphodiesterase [Acidobacteriota bacterium]